MTGVVDKGPQVVGVIYLHLSKTFQHCLSKYSFIQFRLLQFECVVETMDKIIFLKDHPQRVMANEPCLMWGPVKVEYYRGLSWDPSCIFISEPEEVAEFTFCEAGR